MAKTPPVKYLSAIYSSMENTFIPLFVCNMDDESMESRVRRNNPKS